MSIIFETRDSHSPYVETVTQGYTASDGFTIHPADIHWYMVLRRLNGKVHLLVVGPHTASGGLTYGEGAELLWIKIKLGTYMPHLPAREYVDEEMTLPGAASRSFWLKGSAREFPDFDNVETFIERLAREEVLVRDPVVEAALQDHLPEMSPRTVRHRFLQSTGLSQIHIRQYERALRAEALLGQGMSILDTVHSLGYFDQPHLTRSLKQFIGYTPAQIVQMSNPESCHFIQDNQRSPEYNTNQIDNI